MTWYRFRGGGGGPSTSHIVDLAVTVNVPAVLERDGDFPVWSGNVWSGNDEISHKLRVVGAFSVYTTLAGGKVPELTVGSEVGL